MLDDGTFRFPLAPFVQTRRLNCWTWNSGKAGSAEYLDYASGRIVREE